MWAKKVDDDVGGIGNGGVEDGEEGGVGVLGGNGLVVIRWRFPVQSKTDDSISKNLKGENSKCTVFLKRNFKF